MIDGIDVMLETDYLEDREKFNALGEKIIFTGPIDQFYDYRFGKLEYRSLKFENTTHDEENKQGSVNNSLITNVLRQDYNVNRTTFVGNTLYCI